MSFPSSEIKANQKPSKQIRRVRRMKPVVAGTSRKAGATTVLAPDDPIWAIYDSFIEEFRRQDRESVGNDTDLKR